MMIRVRTARGEEYVRVTWGHVLGMGLVVATILVGMALVFCFG